MDSDCPHLETRVNLDLTETPVEGINSHTERKKGIPLRKLEIRILGEACLS